MVYWLNKNDFEADQAKCKDLQRLIDKACNPMKSF